MTFVSSCVYLQIPDYLSPFLSFVKVGSFPHLMQQIDRLCYLLFEHKERTKWSIKNTIISKWGQHSAWKNSVSWHETYVKSGTLSQCLNSFFKFQLPAGVNVLQTKRGTHGEWPFWPKLKTIKSYQNQNFYSKYEAFHALLWNWNLTSSFN